MKKILIFAFAAFMIGFTASCSKEALEPTNCEKNWAENIDLSNSYVKDLYEKTGVAILTEFDDTLDVFYQGADEGVLTIMSLEHLTADQKDASIQWLKENVLDCFSTECIKKYFPRRIFLCATLEVMDTPGCVGGWVDELRYTNNLWDCNGIQHAFPVAQGFVVNVNPLVLQNEETTVDYDTQFRVDIMTLLCDELFMYNDLCDEVTSDPDLFPEDVTELYNRYVRDKYTTDVTGKNKYVKDETLYRGQWSMWHSGYPVDHEKYGDPVTYCDNAKMSLEGFFQFGFPDHGQNYNLGYGQTTFKWPTGTPKTYSSNNNTDKEMRSYTTDGYMSFSTYYDRAPDTIYRDARNLILALCDVNDVKLTVYGDWLIERLWRMSEYFKDFGVDFQKFNPSVANIYKMMEE